MVTGLQRFVDHFEGLEAQYVLIGGAACDVWLTDRGLVFRVTKDLDLVLVVEVLTPAFHQRLWAFVAAGGYTSVERSEARPQFYRFKGPRASGYPFMIELLTRNFLGLPQGVHLTPIPAAEDISSLSAILLDDAYYPFVLATRTMVEGVPIIPAQCLIPLKARAWLDLTARRRAGGVKVKADDIKKHRNDVFRLYLSLGAADRFTLPPALHGDLRRFLESFPPTSPDWSAIRAAVGADLPAAQTAVTQIRAIFQLGPGA